MNNQTLLYHVPTVGELPHTYVNDVLTSGRVHSNGQYSMAATSWLTEFTGTTGCFLTPSGTHALEMAAMLMNVGPDDEVIVPSYTFVTTALAFMRQGATIRFADSGEGDPNVDPESVRACINEKTKAIVLVHYAGVAAPVTELHELSRAHNLYLVEDAAQALSSYWLGSSGQSRHLGTVGDFGVISFHYTKNAHCGEGGCLLVNDPEMAERAAIVREKGTNRKEYAEGRTNKYEWIDTGSSFVLSEINAAFLYGQFFALSELTAVRRRNFFWYVHALKSLSARGWFSLPVVPDYSYTNGHIFYMVLESVDTREALRQHLRSRGIASEAHYKALHKSPYYSACGIETVAPNAEALDAGIVRLPVHPGLSVNELEYVISAVESFFQ